MLVDDVSAIILMVSRIQAVYIDVWGSQIWIKTPIKQYYQILISNGKMPTFIS